MGGTLVSGGSTFALPFTCTLLPFDFIFIEVAVVTAISIVAMLF